MKNAGILKASFIKLFSLPIWENGCVFKCMLKRSENELLTCKWTQYCASLWNMQRIYLFNSIAAFVIW